MCPHLSGDEQDTLHCMATPCHCFIPLCKPTKCAQLPSQHGQAHSAGASPFGLAREALWDEQGHCFLCCLRLPPALLSSCGDRGPPSTGGTPRGGLANRVCWGGGVCCGQLTAPFGAQRPGPAASGAVRSARSRPGRGLLLAGSAASPHSGWHRLFAHWRSFAMGCEERDTAFRWGSAKAGGRWWMALCLCAEQHCLPWVFLSTGNRQRPWWKEEGAVEVQDALIFWSVLWGSCYALLNCVLPKCLEVRGSALGKWVPGQSPAFLCHSTPSLWLLPRAHSNTCWFNCNKSGLVFSIYMFYTSPLHSRLVNFPCFWGLGLVFPSGLFGVACES